MFDPFTFILEHALLSVILAAAILAIIFIAWARYTRSLWGKDFWVALPFIGKMSEWRKMDEGTGNSRPKHSTNPDASYVDRILVVPAEKALYNYYKDGITGISAEGFTRAREFLKLSHQSGRRPMSFFLWAVLALLTIAEAIGTGLLIAPMMSKDITPTLAVLVGSVVAFAIAAIALMITHGAGEDMFRNNLLTKVRNSYRQNSGFRQMDGSPAGETVKPIGPGDDQSTDEDKDVIARLAARINATSLDSMAPKRLRIFLSIVFIVAFGVGTTAYRHYLFNADQDSAASGISSSDRGAGNFQNLFDGSTTPAASNQLPDAVANAAAQSKAREAAAIQNDKANANDAGIMVLALIYVFTQLMGVLTGYKYSFFDNDGEEARRSTGGQVSYEGFLRRFVMPVAQRADLRLGQLRSKLVQVNPAYRDSQQPFSFLEAYLSENDAHSKFQGKPNSKSVSPTTRVGPNVVKFPDEETTAIDYDAIATAILAVVDKESRKIAVNDAVRTYSLTSSEQQTALADAMRRVKSKALPKRAPEISQSLLDAADED